MGEAGRAAEQQASGTAAMVGADVGRLERTRDTFEGPCSNTHMVRPGECLDARRMLISEARLSSCVVLAATPVVLLTTVFVAGEFGLHVEGGIFFRGFGTIVYLFLFGGLAYCLYEFVDTIRRRSLYMTYSGGYIYTIHHAPVKLDQIRSVAIEQGIVKNLVIRTSGRGTVRIRGYMLQRDLNEVKKSIEMLRRSEIPDPREALVSAPGRQRT
jgi:hypothetical protein